MKNLILALVCLTSGLFAASPAVTVAGKATIADTVTLAINNQPAVGSMTISWPSFTEPDGTVVVSGFQTIRLSAGSFSVQLYPTDTATPTNGGTLPVWYTVKYGLTTGATLSENWSVPSTGGTLKIQNVLVPVPAELRVPGGNTLPDNCIVNDLYSLNGALQICTTEDNWTAITGGSSSNGAYILKPSGQGIPYVLSSSTRLATANDITDLLGYTPTKPANSLSEYTANAAAARTNLGLGAIATMDPSQFVLHTDVGAKNGVASLDANTLVPTTQIPALSLLPGQLNVSQLNATGTRSTSTVLFGNGAWAQMDYSQLANKPVIPTDDAQIGNSLGYVKSSQLATVAKSGLYSDLSGLPTFTDIITHPASDFVLSSAVGAPSGVPNLDTNSLVPLAELPTIPNTKISGLGSISTHGASEYVLTTAVNAANGVAPLDANTKVPLANIPQIAYSSLSGLPVIPNKLSQLANDTGFLVHGDLATVAFSGKYSDLTGLPTALGGPATTSSLGLVSVSTGLNVTSGGALSVNTSLFDPAGAATTALSAALLKANNLSDLSSVTAARTNLGLAKVANTGSYSDLLNLPTIPTDDAQLLNGAGYVRSSQLATVATSGKYTDLLSLPTLPGVATATVPGLVMPGTALTVAVSGALNVNTSLFDPAGAATAALNAALQKSRNLSDLTNVAAAQANLNLAPVAISNKYSDLTGLPIIPTKTSQLTNDSGFVSLSSLSTVAVSGSYTDLINKPVLPGLATTSSPGLMAVGSGLLVTPQGTVSVDPSILGTGGVSGTAYLAKASNLSDLQNVATAKTNLGLATVASSGSYTDLSNQPSIPTDDAQLLNGAGYVKSSQLATVATSGKYADLIGVPSTIGVPATTTSLGLVSVGADLLVTPGGQLSVDASQFDPAGAAAAIGTNYLSKTANLSDLANVATAKTNLGLAAVASSGSYPDLINKPLVPTKTSQITNDSGFVSLSDLATVASTGSYADLTNKPILPGIATASTVGLVKPGTALTVSGTGALSVDTSLFDPAGAAAAIGNGFLAKSANLSDLSSVATAKTNLGLAPVASSGSYNDLRNLPTLGTIASHDAGDYVLSSAVGAANGVAPLDATKKLPRANLPALSVADISGLGTVATHNYTEFLTTSQLNAANGVAPLDVNTLVPLANLPNIPYSQITGTPVLAKVATTGLYSDLIGAPGSTGSAGNATGDVTGTLPTLTVVGINGQNIQALGAGVLATNASGVPHKAIAADIISALNYAPLNPNNNLSELSATAAQARTNLGLGTLATKNAVDFLADSGASGLVYRTTQGITRPAIGTDIVSTLGYTPLNAAALGAPNGAGQLDANSLLLTSELPPIPWSTITGAPSFILTSNIGVTVPPLVAGQIPAQYLPSSNLATPTSAGIVQPIAGGGLLISNGQLTVDPAFVGSGGSTTGLLRSANNLSDVASVSATKTNLGLATVASSGSYADLTNKPNFATVATTGSFTDLINQPTIATKTSQLINDSGFITSLSFPVATTTTTGVIKVGSPYLTVDGTGLLSANVGSASGTLAVGNDPRIVGAIQSSTLGQPNGPAVLDGTGKVLLSELPLIPISDISGIGTIATHSASEYVLTSAVNAANGVTPLDSNILVPQANIPNIPWSKITGAPSGLQLPPATTTTLGGVIIKAGLTVDGSGDLAVNFGTSANQALNGSLLGTANGIATLNSSSNIPIAELPAGIPNGLATLDANSHITTAELPISIDATKIADGTVNNVSFETVANARSNIQAQIDAITATGITTAGKYLIAANNLSDLPSKFASLQNLTAAGTGLSNTFTSVQAFVDGFTASDDIFDYGGGIQMWGGITIAKASVSSFTAPTLSVVGAAGSTPYTYQIIAYDEGSGKTLPTPATTITGPDTLTQSNFIVVSWQSIVGAAGYYVLRTVGGVTNLLTPIQAGNANTTILDNGHYGTGTFGPLPTSDTTGSLSVQGPATFSGAISSGVREVTAATDTVDAGADHTLFLNGVSTEKLPPLIVTVYNGATGDPNNGKPVKVGGQELYFANIGGSTTTISGNGNSIWSAGSTVSSISLAVGATAILQWDSQVIPGIWRQIK